MSGRRLRSLVAVASLLGITMSLQAVAAPLFDGRTFTGWEGDTATVWRIDDGTIVAGSLDRRHASGRTARASASLSRPRPAH
jgi:hypothetical protein